MNSNSANTLTTGVKALAFVQPQNTILEMLAEERIGVLEKVDLGSADMLIVKDKGDEAHVVVMTSSGDSIMIPVAFFDRYR